MQFSLKPTKQKAQIIRQSVAVCDRMPYEDYRNNIEQVISDLGIESDLNPIVDFFLDNLLEPNKIYEFAEKKLKKYGVSILLIGSIENRVFVFYHKDRSAVLLSLGRPIESLKFLESFLSISSIERKSAYVGHITLNEKFIRHINEPRVVLCGLYLKDMFPLPRFSLGISDIARSLRTALVGHVKLLDMQLGLKIPDLIAQIVEFRPTIIGISVTFGQQKLLAEFMEELRHLNLNSKPLIVLGGSLCALNKNELVEKYPDVIVSYGPGEKTMVDIVNYTRNIITKEKIEGISYRCGNETVHTPKKSNRFGGEMLPDLDLLERTLDRGGVLLLETSRGCSYACSFCPREHKGIWVGDFAGAINDIMPFISNKYDQRPEIERKIYLVDEEMFGYNELSDARVVGVAEVINQHGFSFETSSRIDQVFRPKNTIDWHKKRLKIWQMLVQYGLDRCLFGVESGVDSILKRFNKKTNSEQNVQALRLLSASGIKIRCTYITFDHLMSFEELVETYKFLGRTDVFLKPMSNASATEIVEAVLVKPLDKEVFVNKPFYSEVSYLLVSMEPLKGSKYAEMVEDEGLIYGENMTMGRYNSRFLVPIVGLFSEYSQMWIDRNFPLDYSLKSIQKYSDQKASQTINLLRCVLKQYSYALLGQMLFLETGAEDLLPDTLSERSKNEMFRLRPVWEKSGENINRKKEILTERIDDFFSELVEHFSIQCEQLAPQLRQKDRKIINEQMAKWAFKKSWELYYA